jgi:hypothetical protein
MSKRDEQETVWMMFECGNGSRWTSTCEDYHGEECNFSGCNCETSVKKIGTTMDGTVAAKWFRRPAEYRPMSATRMAEFHAAWSERSAKAKRR